MYSVWEQEYCPQWKGTDINTLGTKKSSLVLMHLRVVLLYSKAIKDPPRKRQLPNKGLTSEKLNGGQNGQSQSVLYSRK